MTDLELAQAILEKGYTANREAFNALSTEEQEKVLDIHSQLWSERQSQFRDTGI